MLGNRVQNDASATPPNLRPHVTPPWPFTSELLRNNGHLS